MHTCEENTISPRQLAILGSTGSIGQQTLDVVRRHPDLFEVYAICANNSVELLVEQAREFLPEVVCIANEDHYSTVKAALSDLPMKVFAGQQSIVEMVQMEPIDVVVAAMVGYAGLLPTMEAIRAGKTIALANKETLVVAGEIICSLAAEYQVPILPVDSEHSAIFQCLQGNRTSQLDKILLTASGGPFRTFTLEQMQNVTAEQALKHPNWDMGAKITIDSASMMNKGFEVIEAKWLFGVKPKQIQVLVHPQSIVHSAVQYADGAVIAQLGMPDMRLPIQYALTYPERLNSEFPTLDLFSSGPLTFEEPDLERFPNLGLAYKSMERGGNIPCALNAANEVVNLAFRKSEIKFLTMSEIISRTMETIPFIGEPTYEDYVQTDLDARRIAKELVK